MSQGHPIISYLHNMECDIRDIADWSDLLHHLGSSPNQIDPSIVKVIAGPLAELSRRLDASWKKAFEIAGGKA